MNSVLGVTSGNTGFKLVLGPPWRWDVWQTPCSLETILPTGSTSVGV